MSATAPQPIRAEPPPASARRSGQSKKTPAWQQLAPGPTGWFFAEGHGLQPEKTQESAALEPLVGELHPKSELTLLLPMRCLLFLHLQLPSKDREEIQSMAELQVTKALLAGDSGQFACEILEERKDESSVLCAVLRDEKTDALHAPLFTGGHHPGRVHAQVEVLAKQLSADRRHLLLYREGDDVIFALVGKGRLEFAEILDLPSTVHIDGNIINQALWRAELNGISTSFDDIALGAGCGHWQQALAEYFEVPASELSMQWNPDWSLMDFMPAAWKQREDNQQKWALVQRWLLLGSLLYLGVTALALGWLYYLYQQVEATRTVNDGLQEQLIIQEEYNARWEAWRSAVDPTASAIEMLTLVQATLPNKDTQLTHFVLDPNETLIEGEAPTLAAANQAARNLNKAFAERGFNVVSEMPSTMKNQRFHFVTRIQPFAPPAPQP